MTLSPRSQTDRRTALLSLLALAGLGGCGALGGGPVLDAFELRAPTDAPTARRSLARDLVVELPEAGAALDTDRIMIRPNPLQAQFLPGARWTGSAPGMVQTLILRTLQDANAFRFVGRRPLGPGADFALVSELTDFQAELREGTAAIVRVRLIVRLVREQDASVLASRSFQTTAEAASLDTLAVVTAFNVATDALMADLSRWVLERVGAAPSV
jgi:cholesterol transport system auxiliary component